MLIPVLVDLEILVDCSQLPEVINVGGSAIVVASQVDDLFAMMPIGKIPQPLQGCRFRCLLVGQLAPFEIDNVAAQDN